MELTSVWEGNDTDFLSQAIPFYLRGRFTGKLTILDSTWGLGNFWNAQQKKQWRIIGLDEDPAKRAELLANNWNIPIKNESLNVLIFDPPHVSHDWSEFRSAGRYGFAKGKGSIGYLFQPFLLEARRTLKPNGIVIAKIADQVHSAKKWWQANEFMNVARWNEFSVCDQIIKIRSNAEGQPGGRRILHAPQRHSYYIILRKGRC